MNPRNNYLNQRKLHSKLKLPYDDNTVDLTEDLIDDLTGMPS